MTPSTTEVARWRARALAFYLPQFHPTPENDRFWGPGFTEWTNVAAARPLFRGHRQPNLPGELGFYDLRLPETRERQAELARLAGIEGFVYWHYWFAGQRVLHRPFDEVLESGEPDLPFALAWANESWTGIWHGAPQRTLIEQTYPGLADHDAHFDRLEPAFHDPRYIRVDGRPVFVIYRPLAIPRVNDVLERWRRRAERSGLEGLHFIAHLTPRQVGQSSRRGAFDGIVLADLNLRGGSPLSQRVDGWRRRVQKKLRRPTAVRLDQRWRLQLPDEVQQGIIHPCLTPNWDNTPRSAHRGRVYLASNPDLWRTQVSAAVERIDHKPWSRRLLFVKSWNEWAEGNYLEPDRVVGRAWIEATRSGLQTVPDGQGRH